LLPVKIAGRRTNDLLGVPCDAANEGGDMGLDLALGGLVLFTAIRGWLKGFLVQAIRLAGLVTAVYAAAPLREQIKPYVAGQFPTMKPDLMDRILWWGSGVGAYFVLVGVASLIVSVSRRQNFGMAEPNRGDQFAGFGLGVLKGLVVASFLVAALHKYAEPQLVKLAWAEEQKKESYAWKWHEDYQPAAKIWAAPPVQNFVQHIQKMGLPGAPEKGKPEATAEKPVQTASRLPKLALASEPHPPSAMRTPRSITRKPLALKKPFDVRRPSREAAGAGPDRSPTPANDLDTSDLDPEMAATVQSILSKLQGSGDLLP
jgi:uncharacterized membrane protein required for colicin V production